jgi:hypothetical protein
MVWPRFIKSARASVPAASPKWAIRPQIVIRAPLLNSGGTTSKNRALENRTDRGGGPRPAKYFPHDTAYCGYARRVGGDKRTVIRQTRRPLGSEGLGQINSVDECRVEQSGSDRHLSAASVCSTRRRMASGHDSALHTGPRRLLHINRYTSGGRSFRSPVAATATPVSTAAKKQHSNNDNQDQCHKRPSAASFGLIAVNGITKLNLKSSAMRGGLGERGNQTQPRAMVSACRQAAHNIGRHPAISSNGVGGVE